MQKLCFSDQNTGNESTVSSPELSAENNSPHSLSARLILMMMIIMSILAKGKSFTANSGTKAAVLLKGRSSTANSWTRAAVLLGMDRCGSFPLLSAPHSLFSLWTDLKRSEKIPGATTWRRGEWIWLTGPSELHLNSPQGLNIGSIRIFDQIPINLRPLIMIAVSKMLYTI